MGVGVVGGGGGRVTQTCQDIYSGFYSVIQDTRVGMGDNRGRMSSRERNISKRETFLPGTNK